MHFSRLSSFVAATEDDSHPRPQLISKDDLLSDLSLTPGAHIGYIIGEVEKRRFELITRERALAYVRERLSRLLAEAEQSQAAAEE